MMPLFQIFKQSLKKSEIKHLQYTLMIVKDFDKNCS